MLANGTVYIAWGSHEDGMPFAGWLIGYRYDGSSFTQTAAFDSAPDAAKAGIWMSGAAPAVDSQGQLYVLTGNGNFDAAGASAPDDDYGDSLLQLSPSLQVVQYFTPSNQSADNVYNNDFGAGGAAVLADLPAGSPLPHLALAGGKDGNLYVLNRDKIGGYGDGNAWQEVNLGPEGDLSADNPGVIFSVGAYWNYTYYVAGAGEAMKAYRLDPTTAKLSLAATASAPSGGFAFPGSTPSRSCTPTTRATSQGNCGTAVIPAPTRPAMPSNSPFPPLPTARFTWGRAATIPAAHSARPASPGSWTFMG